MAGLAVGTGIDTRIATRFSTRRGHVDVRSVRYSVLSQGDEQLVWPMSLEWVLAGAGHLYATRPARAGAFLMADL
jgi:hypothetical protein